MKRKFGILLLVACTFSAAAADKTEFKRSKPYIYCNVYLSDACFGIVQGDELNMRVSRDFLIYRVLFSFGREATIYYGYHPNVLRDEAASFEPCTVANGFAECKRRTLKDGGIELLAARDEASSVVHMVISQGPAGREEVESFLANVRSCKKVKSSLTCSL